MTGASHIGAPRMLGALTDEAGASLGLQIAALQRLGWRWAELRTVDGKAIADLDADTFARVADTLDAAGVEVVCVASRIGGWSTSIGASPADDIDELTVVARRCARLGTRLVRVMSYPNDGRPERAWRLEVIRRMRELAARAEGFGVTLVHENCVGWAATDPERALDLVSTVASPALRLLFDTGNGLAYGYDAMVMLQSIVDQVVHVHVKDGIRTADGVTYTVPGTGEARVAECVRLLHENGYAGVWSLEPHVSLRPHQGVEADPDAIDTFLECGRALAHLIDRHAPSQHDGAHR